jgi:fructoselysine 6-phosphate deglycase
MADLIPVPDDFEACVQHALNQDDKARVAVATALDHGLERIYLVGCGGSHFGTYPAFDLLDRYASSFTTQRLTSAELISRNPVGLNEHALVVAASHSGNTPETAAAAKFAKEQGAYVVGISRQGKNSLSQTADVHLDYPDTISITEPKLVHNEQIALALLEAEGETGNDLAAQKAAAIRGSMAALPSSLRAVKDEIAETGERVAEIVTDAPFVTVVASGPAYGMAKMMAWCYFQEMQWMDAQAINGGDFFHGPLERIDEHSSLVTLLAEDDSRGMGERTVRFGEKYAGKFAAVDTRVLTLPGISDEARPDLSVLALMSAERRVLDHVAARRGHDTSVRRYMYKVEY